MEDMTIDYRVGDLVTPKSGTPKPGREHMMGKVFVALEFLPPIRRGWPVAVRLSVPPVTPGKRGWKAHHFRKVEPKTQEFWAGKTAPVKPELVDAG